MNEAFTFDVDFRSLDAMLIQLPHAMGKTVLRNALKKAAKPVYNAVKESAPVGLTGNLKAGVLMSPKRYGKSVRSKGSSFFFVGMDKILAPHAWMVEYGTGPRFLANGKYVGEMPPSKFFRTAWDANKEKALQILIKEIENELLKAVKRLRNKAEAGTLGKAATKALL